jgi:hypothetical protein
MHGAASTELAGDSDGFPNQKDVGRIGAITVLSGATLFGIGCGGSDKNGSERAVEWALAPPVGPNWIRISAVIEACIYGQPLVEAPIVEYQEDRVYIELRHTPEDDVGGAPSTSRKSSRNLPRARPG